MRRSRLRPYVPDIALVLCIALTGCFGPPEAPRPEGDVVPAAPTQGRVLPPPPPLPAVTHGGLELPPARPTTGDDRLEPGVVLAILVTGEEALSVDRAPVGRDGAVFMPFLGRVQAAGRTPLELGTLLEQELVSRGYLRRPQVDVQVLAQSGRRAYVLGRVGAPGAYDLPFDRNLTLLQLIAMSGGLATGKSDLEADASAIRLIRTVDGERRIFRLSFLEIVNQAQLGADVAIQDGDVVFVPPKQELFIFGSVRNPGGFPLSDGGRLRIDEALSLAGGYGDTADREGVILIRRTPQGAQTYGIPGDPLARSEVEVTANDTIIVPDRAISRVFVLGAVGSQGGIPLDESDLTVTKILALAGGTAKVAAANSTRLIRRGADGQKRMYTVPVATIIETGDLARDPVVMPGDIIFVPEGFF
jgi:protein involved in polysaccharide export with SLBB domain